MANTFRVRDKRRGDIYGTRPDIHHVATGSSRDENNGFDKSNPYFKYMKMSVFKFLFLIVLIFTAINSCALTFKSKSQEKIESMLKEAKKNFEVLNCQKTIEILNTLLKEKPSSKIKEEIYKYMGVCYDIQNATDKSLNIYLLAHTLYPENKFFTLELGKLYWRTGFYEKSVELFKEVLKQDQVNLDANAGIARSYMLLGFLTRAKEHYQKAVELTEYRNKTFLKEYAVCLLKQRQFSQAIDIINRARTLDTNDILVYKIMSRIYINMGDYNNAIKVLESAEKIFPCSEIISEKIFVLMITGNFKKAQQEADVLIEKDKKSYLAKLAKAIIMIKQKDKNTAIKILKEVSENGTPFVAEIAGKMGSTLFFFNDP